MKTKNIIFFISIFLLILFLVLKINSKSEITSYIISNRLYAEKFNLEIKDDLGILLKNTKFDNKFQINQYSNDNLINLYIIESNKLKGIKYQDNLKNYFNSCIYLGVKKSIIIDISFLDTLIQVNEEKYIANITQEQRQIYLKRKNIVVENENIKKSILLWIIGHELGHLMLNHPIGSFSQNKMTEIVESSSISQKKEFQADSFLVSKIIRQKEICVNMISILLGFLNNEIIGKIGSDIPVGVGILYDYSGKKVVQYSSQGSHPEYIIRIARLFDIIGNYKDYESVKAMTSPFINHLKEKK